MKKIAIVLSLILAITLVMVFSVGCTMPWQKKAQEETAERALEQMSGQDVEIDSNSESTTFTTEEGETTFGTSGELPEDFPGDVPAYPDADITFSHVGSGSEAESASASLETNDSVDEVSAWYEKQIPDNGWEIQSTDSWSSGPDQYVSYTATQGDRELSVGISVSEDVTMITIAVYKDTTTNL